MSTNPAPTPTSDEQTAALEQIDQALSAEDPGFAAQVTEIKSVPNDSKTIIDSEGQLDETTGFASESDSSNVSRPTGFLRRLLYFLLLPFRKISEFLKLKVISIKNRAKLAFTNFREWVKTDLPELLKRWKLKITAVLQFVGYCLSVIKNLERSKKLALLMGITSFGLSIYLLQATLLKGSLLPELSFPLVGTLTDKADHVAYYKSVDDLQYLYHAFPEVKYDVLLKKSIVNLKRDKHSGPNPMGAFEVFLALDAKDTAIEVKDRELEIVDLVSRTLESFAYGETVTEVGKSRMKSQIRENINRILNQGKVIQVYFNTFVTKP